MKKLNVHMDDFCKSMLPEDKEVFVDIVKGIKNLTWCYDFRRYVGANFFLWVHNNDKIEYSNLNNVISDKLICLYDKEKHRRMHENFSIKLLSLKKLNDGVDFGSESFYKEIIGENYHTIEKLNKIKGNNHPFISYLIGFCYLNIAELELLSFEGCGKLLGWDFTFTRTHLRCGQEYYIFFDIAKKYIDIFLNAHGDDEVAGLLLTRCFWEIKNGLECDLYFGASQSIDYYRDEKNGTYDDPETKRREEEKRLEDMNLDFDEYCGEYADDGTGWASLHGLVAEEEMVDDEEEIIREIAYAGAINIKLHEVDDRLVMLCKNSQLASLYKTAEENVYNPDMAGIENTSF